MTISEGSLQHPGLLPNIVQPLVFFAFAFFVFAIIQFAGPDLVGTDGYYHIKVAQLMLDRGFPLEFPWLKFTLLDEEQYSDHHFLLHAIQSIFVYFIEDLRLAAKWSAVTITAFTFACFTEVLRRLNVRWPMFWLVLLFAASIPFMYRMSMPRGQSLGLALQIFAFYLILHRRYFLLAILGAVFVWAYNGFPVLLPLAVAGIASRFIVDGEIDFKVIFSIGSGIIVGLLSHPYFPNDILFLWNHVIPKVFSTEYVTSVGREWYPYNSWKWLTTSHVAIGAFLFGLFVSDYKLLKKDKETVFWLLITLLYFFLFLKSRRFAEYFAPASIMFLALVSRNWRVWREPELVLKSLWNKLVCSAIIVCLSLSYLWVVYQLREDVRDQSPWVAYKGGAEWLAGNTPEGSTVFHSDWDDFPKLFHFNVHNTYIVGLDPDFMRLKHASLFKLWKQTTKGKVDDIAQVMRKFDSEYVFTDLKHKRFIRKLEVNPEFDNVYADSWTKVYKLRSIEDD